MFIHNVVVSSLFFRSLKAIAKWFRSHSHTHTHTNADGRVVRRWALNSNLTLDILKINKFNCDVIARDMAWHGVSVCVYAYEIRELKNKFSKFMCTLNPSQSSYLIVWLRVLFREHTTILFSFIASSSSSSSWAALCECVLLGARARDTCTQPSQSKPN